MQGNTNKNTRAIVSALRCDHKSLRKAAVELIDKALLKHGAQGKPELAVMLAFGAHSRTAQTILRERSRVTKSGALKP
jgi:hypothetical protein